MGLNETERAFGELDRRRLYSRARLMDRQREIYRKIPRVKRLTDKINSLGAEAALASLQKNRRGRERAEARIKEAVRERRQALLIGGYGENDLEEEHFCPICGDSGYVDGKLCSCVKELITGYRQREFARLSPMPESGFDSFDLKYYSKEKITLPNGAEVTPYDTMKSVLEYCRAYARNFKAGAPSLLFVGSAGLGKTHLACSVAARCRDKGFTVMYVSCQSLFNMIEQSRYSGEDRWEKVMDCDLLVLDDLGAENMTGYCLSAFYNIINTRMIEKRRCIYTTNLVSEAAFRKRYGEKISSRLFGTCKVFYFQGKDIRLIKNSL